MVAGQATIRMFGCFSPALVNCSRVGGASPLTGAGVLPSGIISQVENRNCMSGSDYNENDNMKVRESAARWPKGLSLVGKVR